MLDPLLNPKICSEVSQQEAQILLNEFRGGQFSPSPESISQEQPQRIITALTKLLHAYELGQVEYCGSRFVNNPNQGNLTTDSANLNLLNPEIAKVEVKYPNKIKEPQEFANRDPISISTMDDKALTKVTPMGSIDPPMPGILFVDGVLRTPCPEGFITNLGYYADLYINSKPQEFKKLEINPAKPVFNIGYPKETSFVPMPLKAELVGLSAELGTKIAKPNPDDPLVWGIRPRQELGQYQIQETDKDDLLRVELDKKFYPSKPEQEYWKSVLPLPQDLEARIKETPKDLIHFITSYLGIKKDKDLSNFRYVCNPYLSTFLQKHKKDLALITNELKVGHCDLLSWYVAAQLRAHGKPAWVAGARVTTKEGKSFNDAYRHSVVITVDDNGKLLQYDPTVHTDYDPAYHPEVMDKGVIDALDRKFTQAKSTNTKLKVLRSFANDVLELRKKAEANSNVGNYISDLSMGYLASLDSSKTKFSQGLSLIRGEVSDWTYLPREASLENISRKVYELTWAANLSDDGIFSLYGDFYKLGSQASRANFDWLVSTLRDKQIPWDKEIHGDFNLLEAFKTNNFKLEYLARYFYHTGSHYLMEPIMANNLPIQLLVELSRYQIPNSVKDLVDFGSLYDYKLHSIEFENFKYSKIFIKLLAHSILLREFSNLKGLTTKGIDSDDNFIRDNFNGRELENKVFDLRHQLAIFVSESQRACIDAVYRKSFLQKIDQDEDWFKNISYKILGIDKAKYKNCIRELPVVEQIPIKTKDDLIYPFRLEPSDNQHLIAQYIKVIKRIDTNQSSGRTIINEDKRIYTPGDDIRRVDWPAWARSDKYYVRQNPDHAIDISTPLHVVMDVNDGIVSGAKRIQVVELIRALQIESKKTQREVYLSLNNSKSYFKLSSKRSPRSIYEALVSYSKACSNDDVTMSSFQGKTNFSYIDGKQVKMPKNLLFVSDSYSKISSAQYLFSKHPKSRIGTIYLYDEPYKIYPLVEDEWVENGFVELETAKA